MHPMSLATQEIKDDLNAPVKSSTARRIRTVLRKFHGANFRFLRRRAISEYRRENEEQEAVEPNWLSSLKDSLKRSG